MVIILALPYYIKYGNNFKIFPYCKNMVIYHIINMVILPYFCNMVTCNMETLPYFHNMVTYNMVTSFTIFCAIWEDEKYGNFSSPV